MKTWLLERFQRLFSKKLPGRYVFSQFIAKMLSPKNGTVKGYIGAYHVTLDLRDTIQQQIYFGLYEDTDTKFFNRLLKPGDVFFDIGANVGYYSFMASQLVGNTGRVYSFEPIAANVSAIRQNIQANAVSNIIVNSVAIGSKNGLLTLYVGDNDLGNSGWASKVKSERRRNKVDIQMVSLDEYVKDERINKISHVKMDIEGSEIDALLGGKELFSREEAPDLLCEVNPYLLGMQNLDSRALTRCIAGYGYSLFQTDDLFPVDPGAILARLTNLFCTKNITRVDSLRLK